MSGLRERNSASREPSFEPVVSVVIASYNCARYLADAVRSAVSQTLRQIEIIVVDDCSTDESREVAKALALTDDRIRLIERVVNSGAGAARNVAITAARGRWIAVLDADDLMHPSRLETLVAEAERSGAEVCFDNFLAFNEHGKADPLLSPTTASARWISAAEFIGGNELLGTRPVLGYLKPLMRREFLIRNDVCYNGGMRIGEDYDIVVQILAHGGRLRLADHLGYFYREHAGSTSHRITVEEVAAIGAADRRLRRLFPPGARDVHEAFDARARGIDRVAAFSGLVADLKAGRLGAALATVRARPSTLVLLYRAAVSGISRRLAEAMPRAASVDRGKTACIVSRQRLVGNTNGSSTYLLSLTEALKQRGYRVTLVSPSTATLGRWPYLRLKPEMGVFDAIDVRGAWRITPRLFIAKSVRIHMKAAVTVLERLARRAGLTTGRWVKPAPYAVAAPWSLDDFLFVARHVPRDSDLVLADYAFTSVALPFALSPRARTAIVMHDLFSSRSGQFRKVAETDSVAVIDEASEADLLDSADAVIAIQEQEARKVALLLPRRRVIVAPMACRTVTAAQPGDSRVVLFVGSNTAPNVVGLKWFLADVWPAVRTARPDSTLQVVGSVANAFDAAPAGVTFLGQVDDLAASYSQAGVVVSPLTVGSGLKIKLIEALAHGKAMVATSVTAQGVEDAVAEAARIEDDADRFADAVSRLLGDERAREELGEKALECARRHFSPQACYAEFLDFADGVDPPAKIDTRPETPRVAAAS